MRKLKTFSLTAIVFICLAVAANAGTVLLPSDDIVLLSADDFVGISFWIISMGTLAATAFFFLERGSVVSGWRAPVTVAGLITGIAFVHYMYMRGVWVQTGDSPTIYRYIEWIITMPLQMIVFYLILATIRKVSSGMFWRLLIGTLVMIIGGYAGEAGVINSMLGFVIWMVGWVYILYEIFSGEAGKLASKSGNKIFVTCFGTLRMIVTVGWCIYPLGYILGHITGGVDANTLNVIYNLADFVNKIAFGIIIWVAAVSSGGRVR